MLQAFLMSVPSYLPVSVDMQAEPSPAVSWLQVVHLLPIRLRLLLSHPMELLVLEWGYNHHLRYSVLV